MKVSPVQTSFAAGEVSPLLLGRHDSEGYKNGVVLLKNMLPDSRGPARSRMGFEYRGEFVGDDCRIIGVPVSDRYAYNALLTEHNLYINSINGNSPGVTYTTNPYFTDLGYGWLTEVSGKPGNPLVSFTKGKCLMNIDSGGQGAWAALSQELTILPGVLRISLLMTKANVPVNVRLGTTLGGDDLGSITITDLSYQIEFPVNPTTVWITLEILQDPDVAGDVEVDFFYAENAETEGAFFTTPYLNHELASIYHVEDPDGQSVYFLHNNHPPYELQYDPVTDTFQWDIVTFVGAPAEWQLDNYPSAGAFYEGRLWLGGCVIRPQTFWGSKSGETKDFTVGTNDNDGIEFTIAQFGKIRWIQGFKNLLVGTSHGEHIVTSEGAYISPSDVEVKQQSSYGSTNIQPVQVGDQMFYVSADTTKLRAMQYEWQADNWLSQDLTFASQHITKSGIRHIAWVQNPSNVFACVLNDGNMATLVYDRANNVYGWSILDVSGRVLDVSSTYIEGIDQTSIVIDRKPGIISFERSLPNSPPVYMDSWLLATVIDTDTYNLFSSEIWQLVSVDGYDLLAPTGLAVVAGPPRMGSYIDEPVTIGGLKHLNGYTCQVIIDGAVHPDVLVTNGNANLLWGGDVIYCGLKMTRKLITLPLNTMTATGPGMSYHKRYNKLYIRMLESAKPLVNGFRSPTRKAADEMDTPGGMLTEDVQSVLLGSDKYTLIDVEQDLPLPLTILSIFGEVTQGML